MKLNPVKSAIPTLFLLVFLTSGCNYVFHRSHYYNYSTRKIWIAGAVEAREMEAVRKQLHFRQAGHITYDYFKCPKGLILPDDTARFKVMVGEIVYARLNNIQFDSIVYDPLNFNEKSKNGSKAYISSLGTIYGKRRNKKIIRRFEAICLPEVNASVIQVSTFKSLGF